MGALALIAAIFAAAPAASAQEDYNRDEDGRVLRGPYLTGRFIDNTFINVNGGGNIYMGGNTESLMAPALNVTLGKWVTPSVGMRLGYLGLNTSYWSFDSHAFGNTLDPDKGMFRQKFGFAYVHGDVMWNMSSALGGYKETRVWEVVPYVHAGFFRSYGLDGADFSDNEFAAGAGLMNKVRLADRVSLIMDTRGTVVSASVRGGSGPNVILSSTIGVAFNIGDTGFDRASTVITELEMENMLMMAGLEEEAEILERERRLLAEKNARLAAENKELAERVKVCRKIIDQAKNEKKVNLFENVTPAAFFFEIGSDKLSKKEKEHLDFYVRNILQGKDDASEVTVTVMGSADSGTGSLRRNRHLSESRSLYLFKLLTEQYGIEPSRLIMKAEVTDAKTAPELSRAVIISF